MTPEARAKKIEQFQSELPKLLEPHQIIVQGSSERDLDGRFIHDPTYQSFLGSTSIFELTKEQVNTGLFRYWREVLFNQELSKCRERLMQEK
jgi:hypothetical protein